MFIKTKTIPVDSTGDIVTSGDITDGSGNILSDKQDKTLSSSITVEGVTQTTVEGTLNALNNKAGGVQSDWDQNTTTELDYIKNKPTLGTASSKDVAASGNASATQVVMGNDSRLTDSRTPTSHTHTKSEITDFPSLGTASAKDIASSGNASTTQVVMGNDTRLTDARTPTSHTHTKSQITDFPTLGTASAKDVPTSGNASTSQVVMGNDSRLTDSRNAADVYSWAKASTKPTYTASEVGAASTTDLANGLATRNNLFYATCSTAASTVSKTVVLSDSTYTPVAGDLFVIRFSNGNSVSSPTLNINSKGAKTWREDYTTGTYGAGYPSAAKNFLIRYDGKNFYTVASDAPYRSYTSEKIYVGGAAGANGSVTAQTTDPGAGSSLTTGNIVLVYEA